MFLESKCGLRLRTSEMYKSLSSSSTNVQFPLLTFSDAYHICTQKLSSAREKKLISP